VILTGQETRNELAALTGSSASADEVLAAAWFLSARANTDSVPEPRAVWAAWIVDELTGGEVLELLRLEDWLTGARRCVLCGCTDNVACAGGCSWSTPDVGSRCAL
jgi:hypothetical protein